MTTKRTMRFKVGQKVRLRAEGGSARYNEGTVVARDEEWLTIEFSDRGGTYTLKLGYDYEEGFWYEEQDWGLWMDLKAL